MSLALRASLNKVRRRDLDQAAWLVAHATVVIALIIATLTLPVLAQAETRPLWRDLNASQQELLAPFAKQWNGWKPEEKRVWISLANRFPKFSAKNKQRARKRISEWATLTQKQRRTARRNYRIAREKRRADRMAEWERYRNMTNEQKSILRQSGSAFGSGTRSGLAPDGAQPLK